MTSFLTTEALSVVKYELYLNMKAVDFDSCAFTSGYIDFFEDLSDLCAMHTGFKSMTIQYMAKSHY